MAGGPRDLRPLADARDAVTDDVRQFPPPLAVVTGVARALAAAEPPAERLRRLCDYLRGALPAREVRLRAGTRAGNQAAGGDAISDDVPFAVSIPWHQGRDAVLEVVGSSRPPAELRPILDTAATLLATVLPVLDDGGDDEAALERRLSRLTIDSLPVGLYVVDRQYRIVLWNRKRETGTQGLRRDEVLGRPAFEVLHRQPIAAPVRA